jgi:dTDP-4-amino-4,6-dideoxygalactose transaminase
MQLALLGGPQLGAPAGDQHPTFSDDARNRIDSILRRGATVGLSKAQPDVGEFEEVVARWLGMPHCLGTSSGHAALQAALISLDIANGDEVITTPYTWGASISCILNNRAVPIFADVDRETGLLDAQAVEAAVGPRTAAILVVHIYGQPADMTALAAVAKRHDLALIEDGSQAHGAQHRGGLVGSFGDASGFSCMGGKLLAGSEGGFLVTKTAESYCRAVMATQHMRGSGDDEQPGRADEPTWNSDWDRYVDSLVYTYRINAITAALLVEQLKKLDVENDGRRQNVQAFRAAMQGVRCITFPEYDAGDEIVYHLLTMNFDAEHAGISKQTYIEAVVAEGLRFFAYVPDPAYRWPRLQQTYDGPRVTWEDVLRDEAPQDYGSLLLPGVERKVDRGVELVWNYIAPDAERMQRLAEIFLKVEENLPALREHERTTARSASAAVAG